MTATGPRMVAAELIFELAPPHPSSASRPALGTLDAIDAKVEAVLPDPHLASPGGSTRPPATARVLHVINGEHYTGAERVQELLGAQLPSLGYGVALICVKPDEFPALRRTRDVPLHLAPMKGRFDLRPVRKIARLIRDEGFDIVHSHSPRAALLTALAARLTGAAHVYHLHSVTAADSTHRVRNRVNATVERASLRRVAAVIAVSRSLGQYAINAGLPSERVIVVHNGVPTRGALTPRPTPDSPWTLGVVARFRPRKGLEVLLEALAELRRRGHDIRVRAIGAFDTPEYEATIRALEMRLDLPGWIEWRGFRNDVNAELSAVDLFVLPSLFGEGLPMAVLEAMAVGLPVISTRVEGVPEAVRDGVDGLVCEPGNSAALADAIERFATGQIDWQTVRVAAHARQGEHFSDLSMSRGVAEVYGHVLAAARSGPA
jgi:glycosyltransferase involved in cell wall biosynthesis